MKNNINKGFTIVETMIVLAIAGLILLIVLLAVPALQRSSTNTNIKSDASAIVSAITDFESNNGGTVPTASNFSQSGGVMTIGTASASGSSSSYISSTAKIQSADSIATASGAKVASNILSGTNITGSTATANNDAIVIDFGISCDGGTSSARIISVFYPVQTSSGFDYSNNDCLQA